MHGKKGRQANRQGKQAGKASRQARQAGRQGGRPFLEDALRRTRPDIERPGSTPDDVELLAFEYVDERDAARTLVHEAADHLLSVGPELKSEKQARAQLEQEIRARGSMRVIERAHERYRDPWHYYAKSLMVGSTDLADDVVQEAFVDLLRAHPNFTDPKPVHGWMRTAIHGAALRMLGVSNLEVGLEHEPDMAASLRDPGPSPQRQAMRNERAHRLQRVLQEAHPEDREAYVLRHLAQPPWKVSAIAKKQGVSRQTVSNRIGRVRDELLDCLDE
jgi:RNA polymerase sigma factor (sigma-70 family)